MQDRSVIEWGNYKADTWNGIDSLQNKVFQEFLRDIKNSPHLFEQHNLYLAGGILENWTTWDVDFAITGPYSPSRILPAMTWITHLGFKYGVYPDVVYIDELFDLHEWQQKTNRDFTEKWVYLLSDTFIKDGEKKDMSGGEWIDGLYRVLYTFPYSKNYDAILNGHHYKKAIKIF